MTNAKAKLLMGSAALVIALGYLGITGVRSGWVYYLDVDEYIASEGAQADRARVHGIVSEQGLEVSPAALSARFTLRGASRELRVEYRGAVPDQFGSGRQVVVEGRMGALGVFEADVLMTKCASKYEAQSEPASGTPGGSP